MALAHEPLHEIRESFTVDWYRCPIPKETLKNLTQRSNARGFLQTAGYLALLVVAGGAAWVFFTHALWIAFAVALFVYGTICSFNPGLVTHELSHGTVFKTKGLNGFFLRFFSLIGWVNFLYYKRSHTFHHLYTLHPRGDREVVLPQTPSLHPLRLFFLFTLNIPGLWETVRGTIRLAFLGKFTTEWAEALYPPEDHAARAMTRRWAWIVLIFHAAIIAVAIIFRLWMLPILVTAGGFVGTWWSYFVGMPMHAGLRDNVPDFRLCCRTIKLDPLSRFIYWHMSFHTEHHMYAAVPCYNLHRLARVIAPDMPRPRSVAEAWKEMRDVYRRQKSDPTYQFDTPLPKLLATGSAQDAVGASLGDLKPTDLG
jgi:fatty acid desaturase